MSISSGLIPIVHIGDHVLHHVSSKSFDFPSRDKIEEARDWSKWHPNGQLGLWCSTQPNLCSAFGKYIYRVTMKEDARIMGLSYGALRKYTGSATEREEYRAMVNELLPHADVLYVVDAYQEVGEVIVLNFDAIADFRIETEECENRTVKLIT